MRVFFTSYSPAFHCRKCLRKTYCIYLNLCSAHRHASCERSYFAPAHALSTSNVCRTYTNSQTWLQKAFFLFLFLFFTGKKTLKDPVIHRLVVELFSFLLCTLKKQGCLLLPVLSIVITDQPTYASLLPPTTHTHPINPTPTTNTCPRGFSLVLLRKPVREEERCVGWSQSDDPTAC